MGVFLERAGQHGKARANMIQRRFASLVYVYINSRPEVFNIFKTL